MAQLFYCSNCGGSLESDKLIQCPHCGVSLRGAYEGSLEGRSRTQHAYAKHKAEENAVERRRKWDVFWNKALKPILVRFVVPTCLLVGLVGLLGLLILAGNTLHRLFQPLITGTNHTNLRSIIATIAVLATPLASFALFSIIPIRDWLDAFYWWALIKADLLDTRTSAEILHDIRSGSPEMFKPLTDIEMFHSQDPRKDWFSDPETARQPSHYLGLDWPTSRAKKYFVIIQTAIWLIGITVFVIMMGLDNLAYEATVLTSIPSPLLLSILVAIGSFILVHLTYMIYKPIRNKWKNKFLSIKKDKKGNSILLSILVAIGSFILVHLIPKPIRNKWKNEFLSIKKDKKGNSICPECGLPFKSDDDTYAHIKRWHSR